MMMVGSCVIKFELKVLLLLLGKKVLTNLNNIHVISSIVVVSKISIENIVIIVVVVVIVVPLITEDCEKIS